MRKLHWKYSGDKACGPWALRQLTEASDQTILSVCCLHGYEPSKGMEPYSFIEAGKQLGLKFGPAMMPSEPVSLAYVAAISAEQGATVVVGVPGHVLVVSKGEVLDPGITPLETPVEFAVEVKEDKNEICYP